MLSIDYSRSLTPDSGLLLLRRVAAAAGAGACLFVLEVTAVLVVVAAAAAASAACVRLPTELPRVLWLLLHLSPFFFQVCIHRNNSSSF